QRGQTYLLLLKLTARLTTGLSAGCAHREPSAWFPENTSARERSRPAPRRCRASPSDPGTPARPATCPPDPPTVPRPDRRLKAHPWPAEAVGRSVGWIDAHPRRAAGGGEAPRHGT